MTFKTGEIGETRRVKRFLVSLISPFFLILLVLGATWKLTLSDRIIARGDLLLYFYPLRDYASQAIREGRLPLWNPYTFMGAPFLANSQVGFFYPLNVLTAWLPVERAVSWNITLHLAIAALGAYALARRGFGLTRMASFACGLAFGLGGYLGAQVEHLNQLQVLAWLPIGVLWVIEAGGEDQSRQTSQIGRFAGRVAGLTGVIALQMLAGHTQSLYISSVALGLAALTSTAAGLWRSRSLGVQAARHTAMPLLVAVAAALLAAAICGVQLLPTLELSRESARAGGLPFNEAAAFSWRPWVIARALMPTYGDPLFPEYVAYLGAGGLALALLGGLGMMSRDDGLVPTRTSALLPLALLVVGFVLALGVATPVFNVLYCFMPGFNLFRAQARWLVLCALGAALLASLGVQRLQRDLNTARMRNWLIAWIGLVGLWGVGLLLGMRLSPEPEYRALPDHRVLMGWIVMAAVTTMLIVGVWRLTIRDWRPGSGKWRVNRSLPIGAGLLLLAFTLELLAAAQFQPYARAVDRQSLTSLRPATAHLLAELEMEPTHAGRTLALSSRFFDPGDKAEQELIFGPQLNADETYDRLIASKHKEILSPNLPLYYRLLSVDGYDGGLLPTRRYAEFVRQFTTTPTGAIDGRLREFLGGVPANDWLEQMAVHYVIADKTQDVFIDGIYHDLLFSAPIAPTTSDIPLRPFASTALGLLLGADNARTGDVIATAEVTFDDGLSESFTLRAREPVTPYFGVRLQWEGRKMPQTLRLRSLEAQPVLRAITSIDETDGTFLSQMVTGDHDMRLVHSGDVKIYRNLRPAPRVVLQDERGEPRDLERLGGEIVEERAEFVHIRLPDPALRRPNQRLVLRDACFPGWVARVDGAEAPIECIDILFRTVALPADAREVTFSYEPQSVRLGLMVSAGGVTLWLVLSVLAGITSSYVGRVRRADHLLGT